MVNIQLFSSSVPQSLKNTARANSGSTDEEENRTLSQRKVPDNYSVNADPRRRNYSKVPKQNKMDFEGKLGQVVVTNEDMSARSW